MYGSQQGSGLGGIFMKRILTMMLFVVCCFLCSTAWASGYPDYLNGDRNFLLCGGHMGVGWYVDKSSLVVQQYNPPVYQLAVNVLIVEDADRGNTVPSRMETKEYLYNWDERTMYCWWDEKSAWQYIRPVGCMAETGHFFAGEMAFYIAYRMKFYGGRKWYDSHTGNYESPNFSDHLYAVVDGSE